MKTKNKNETLKRLQEESTILHLLYETQLNYTKQELMNITGKSERAVRAELEEIANFYPIKASAGSKGYSLIWFNENSSIEELKIANEDAFNQICEIQNRINALKARLKPLIATQRATALQLLNKGVNANEDDK